MGSRHLCTPDRDGVQVRLVEGWVDTPAANPRALRPHSQDDFDQDIAVRKARHAAVAIADEPGQPTTDWTGLRLATWSSKPRSKIATQSANVLQRARNALPSGSQLLRTKPS